MTETELKAARYDAFCRINLMSDEDEEKVSEFLSDAEELPSTAAEFHQYADELISALAMFDAQHATQQ